MTVLVSRLGRSLRRWYAPVETVYPAARGSEGELSGQCVGQYFPVSHCRLASSPMNAASSDEVGRTQCWMGRNGPPTWMKHKVWIMLRGA